MAKLISFTKQEYVYKKYPLNIYIFRDLTIYILSAILIYSINNINLEGNLYFLNFILFPLIFSFGFFLFANIHEWFHYFGVLLTKGKSYLNPIGSILRLFYYDFEENSNKQNMTMMLMGILAQWPIAILYFYFIPHNTLVLVVFNAGLLLSIFLTPFIELYIAYPKYLGKMSFKACYERHEPYRSRNLFLSLLAAIPFVAIYLWFFIPKL